MNKNVESRFTKGLNKIKVNYPNKRILIISHYAILNAILYYFSDGNIGTGKTQFMNRSITTLKLLEDTATIIEYNNTNHSV